MSGGLQKGDCKTILLKRTGDIVGGYLPNMCESLADGERVLKEVAPEGSSQLDRSPCLMAGPQTEILFPLVSADSQSVLTDTGRKHSKSCLLEERALKTQSTCRQTVKSLFC